MKIINKNTQEKGVALVLALTILSILVGIAGYFSMNIGMELQGSKGYLNSVKAKALAEAGLAETIARIKADVRQTKMFNPDILDKDKTPNPSKFPDLVHKKYSTRADPSQGVWGDDVDSDSDGETATDTDEIVTVNDKGTPASITDDDGYYVLVRDANARLDLNTLTPESKGLLVQFSSVRSESVDANDVVISGSIADRIVTGRSSLPNGKYTTVDQLRSVLGKEDFQKIESDIDHKLTTKSSNQIVSGGLVARYYGLDRSGSTPEIKSSDYKGTVIDHGTNSFLEYGENIFAFNSAVDFAFKTETDDQHVDPVLPSFDATKDFAVVWTGYIFIPNTTPITFLISYHGGFRMRIRDQVLAASSQWSPGNSGEVVVTASLPAGWEPVLIEYYSTGSPSINIHWDGGYHYLDPGIQKNNASDDPDIDLRTQNTLMPTASFGFKAGGIYEISSTGVVRDKQGKIQAEKTITSVVRIWDYAHESTVQDFSDANATRSFVNFDDACPIHHVGDPRFWSLEFSPTAKTRAYDTMYNAIKLGYWEDFEQIDSTILPGSFNPTYPFYDLSTPKEAWVPRPGASIDFIDSDGDLDKELTFVNLSASSILVDWIGEGATIDAPNPAFAFKDFWVRFEEDDGVGPIDSATYEDQSLAGSGPKDYDGIKHDAGALPGFPDPEDRNANFAIDGPQPWWVGWPFIRMSGIHYNFFTKQEVIPGPPGKSGPGEDFFDTNNPATTGHEFETNVNGVVSTQRVGYTYKKIYLIGVYQNNLYFYTGRISKSGQTDNGFVWLVYRADAIANAAKTFGFSTLGNAFFSLLDGTIGLRKIDSVRVVPLENSKGVFTSRTINATGAKEWGTVSYTAFHDPVGSHVAVKLGQGGGSPSIPVNSGDAISSALGASQTVQYSAELSMDLLNGAGAAEVNYRQPVFADITMTYLVDADTLYYRED